VSGDVWVIRDRDNQILGAGSTEGQAWINFFGLTGRYFCGRHFMAWVGFARKENRLACTKLFTPLLDL
jgi:hypothetical protein